MSKNQFFRKFKNSIKSLSIVKVEESFRKLAGAEIFIRREDGKLEKVGHNLVVDSAYALLAALALAPEDLLGGFTFISAGVGEILWDPMHPPAPLNTDVKLANEIDRVAISDKYFVDPSTGEPVDYRTNVIDLIGVFGEGQAVGAIVEIGLFGGNASISIDSGTLISIIRFAVKNKGHAETLTWIFRFTF